MNLMRLVCFAAVLNIATSCNWQQRRSDCTASCGGYGMLQVDYFTSDDACFDNPPASYIEPCGVDHCNVCSSLSIHVSGIAPSIVSDELVAASGSSLRWQGNNITISYSTTIEAYVLRYMGTITAAYPASAMMAAFYVAPRSRWQPASSTNASIVVVDAGCLACPQGFYLDSNDGVCKQVRLACQDGEIAGAAPTPTSDRQCLTRSLPNCMQASLLDSSVCVACQPGFWLHNGGCVETCPDNSPYPVPNVGSCRMCPAGHVLSERTQTCMPCASGACLYCQQNQTFVCSECEIGQVLQDGSCQERSAVITVTFAGNAIEPALIVDYLTHRYNLVFRVANLDAVAYANHLNVVMAACRLAVRTCLELTDLNLIFAGDDLRTALQAEFGLEYSLDGTQVTPPIPAPEDNDLILGLSRNMVALIGVCALALLAIALAVGLKSKRSESLILRRSRHQQKVLRKYATSDMTHQPKSKDNRPYLERHRDVILWFKISEFVRMAGLGRNGRPYTWMAGIVSTRKAERHLYQQRPGSFFVRVSSEDCGYLLSVTTLSGSVIHIPIRIGTTDTIRHGYRLGQSLGGGIYHQSLNKLVAYYNKRPIMRGVRLKYPRADGGRSFRILMRHIRMMTSTSTLAGSSPSHGSELASSNSDEVVYETLEQMHARRAAMGYTGDEQLYEAVDRMAMRHLDLDLDLDDSRIDEDGMLVIGTPSPSPDQSGNVAQSLRRALAGSEAVALDLSAEDQAYHQHLAFGEKTEDVPPALGDSPDTSDNEDTTEGFIDDDDALTSLTELACGSTTEPIKHGSRMSPSYHHIDDLARLAETDIDRAASPMPGSTRSRACTQALPRPPPHFNSNPTSSGTSSLEAHQFNSMRPPPLTHLRTPTSAPSDPHPLRQQRPPLPIYSAMDQQQVNPETFSPAHVSPEATRPRSPFLRLAHGIYPVQKKLIEGIDTSSSSTDAASPPTGIRRTHRQRATRRSKPKPAELSITTLADGSLALTVNNETVNLQPGQSNIRMQLQHDGRIHLLDEESSA
eukprot:TRINITY_DN6311_c0_g1_i1.p1 TRINITY_DN6311_c0_g1~~TRINITY_DN6311_c0_g1_i1.p1  ORF type:complete len:1026 (+),score=185.96 TRINITY_DN6311_c0_g1_i1:139-3216(+)